MEIDVIRYDGQGIELQLTEVEDIQIELAGRKIVYETKPDGTTEITFSDQGTGRSCGSCTLCCKLLPIPALNKPASHRCDYQHATKGCRIYATRPNACQAWACRWLADFSTKGMPRPDRCHYVIDVIEDNVVMTPNDGSKPTVVPVMQVWVDPAFREAWNEPHLRSYMATMAEKFRMATIIRYSNSDAFTIFPPAIASDREWHYERGGQILTEEAMRARIAEVTS